MANQNTQVTRLHDIQTKSERRSGVIINYIETVRISQKE